MSSAEKEAVKRAFDKEMVAYWRKRCKENPDDEVAAAELEALELQMDIQGDVTI